MESMNRDEQAPVPDPDLEKFFAAARQSGNLDLPYELRKSLLDAAETVQLDRAAQRTHRRWGDWWAGLLSGFPIWRPAGVLAVFALLGFGFGFVFAENVELVAAELMIVDAELPAEDIFSSLEQVMLEG